MTPIAIAGRSGSAEESDMSTNAAAQLRISACETEANTPAGAHCQAHAPVRARMNATRSSTDAFGITHVLYPASTYADTVAS